MKRKYLWKSVLSVILSASMVLSPVMGYAADLSGISYEETFDVGEDGEEVDALEDYDIELSENSAADQEIILLTEEGEGEEGTVEKTEQTISVQPMTLTVGESEKITVSGANTDLTFTLMTGEGVISVGADGTVTAQKKGSATVKVSAAETEQYKSAETTVAVTVQAVDQSISASDITLDYGTTKKIAVSGAKTELSYAVDQAGADVISVAADGTITTKSAGTATVTVTAAASDAYNTASTTLKVTVNALAQSVSVDEKSILGYYGDNNLVAKGSALTSVSYSVTKGTDVISVDATSGAITTLKAGTAEITVTAEAENGYSKATAVITVSIHKAQQTIAASDVSLAFGETKKITVNGAAKDSKISYVVTGDAVAVDTDGTITTKNAGTSQVKITVEGNDCYNASNTVEIEVRVSQVSQSIDAKDITITYDPANTSVQVEATAKTTLTFEMTDGGNGVADITSSGLLTIKKAGTASIHITAAEGNYTAAEKTITLTVKKASQSVNAGDISIVYGTNNNQAQINATEQKTSLKYSVTGGTDVASVSDAGLVTFKKAGTATVKITAQADDFYEEASTSISVSASIAEQTITASNVTWTYETTETTVIQAVAETTLSYAVTSGTDYISVNESTGEVTIKKPGTAEVTITAKEEGSYKSATKTITVTIKKAEQNLVTKDIDAVFGENDNKATIELEGLKTSLSYSLKKGSDVISLDISTDTVSFKKAGTATIEVNASEDEYYKSAKATIAIVVSAADQTLTGDDISITYEKDKKGSAAVKTSAAAGLSEGITITYKVASGSDVISVDSTTGEYSVLKAGTAEITATASSNYGYNSAKTTLKVNIEKAEPVIVAEDVHYIIDMAEGAVNEIALNVKTADESVTTQFTYTSDNAEIATVDKDGKVTALAPGTAGITVEAAENDCYKAATKVVTVDISVAVQNVTVESIDDIVYAADTTVQINASTDAEEEHKDGIVFSYQVTEGTDVVSVSKTGLISLKKAGAASIKVTASNNSYYGTATKTVEVTVLKADPTITSANISMTYAKSATKQMTVTTNGGSLSYTSSNTKVVTVSDTGKITVAGAGSATITVKTAETDCYKSGSKSVKVTVNKATPTITASNISIAYNVNRTKAIGAKTTGGTLSYASSNVKVATVSSAGTLTLKGVGTTNITITSAANTNYVAATKVIKVTVTKGTPTITASNISMVYKKKGTKAIGAKTTGGKLTYVSSNKKVATVDAAGKLTIKGYGITTITITSAATTNFNAGSKKITFSVIPKTVTVSSNKSTSKGVITIKWKKVSGIDGYQLQQSTTSNFTAATTKTAVAPKSYKFTPIGGLKSGSKVYIRIRAYKKANGSTVYGAWRTMAGVVVK